MCNVCLRQHVFLPCWHSPGWLAGLLAGLLAGWLASLLACWLACLLAFWLAGLLAILYLFCILVVRMLKIAQQITNIFKDAKKHTKIQKNDKQ